MMVSSLVLVVFALWGRCRSVRCSGASPWCSGRASWLVPVVLLATQRVVTQAAPGLGLPFAVSALMTLDCLKCPSPSVLGQRTIGAPRRLGLAAKLTRIHPCWLDYLAISRQHVRCAYHTRPVFLLCAAHALSLHWLRSSAQFFVFKLSQGGER
ncbi:uncharacterized protein B0H18DRAFT_120534 [Fomitopsis serialis]|uniref:uncharacterized protein n=1 Tax=Fomitopsis serialis TaxID=139415 RepID=UPI002007A2ED|nr:uncharacterized protein B0H18DRAFT_120534 [Neoantrodia serialis]KAH9930980.1 hypothetical protein B0H18DRAFT_120534 [Neoantrodia serialis]